MKVTLGFFLLGLLLPVASRAEVLDKAPNGFQLKTVVAVAAPPAQVYDALVRSVGQWWDAAHTFSGDARNLSLAAEPGGCFCEKLPDGGGVRHLTVVYVAPGQKLVLTGGLGPLQGMGVSGNLSFALAKAETGTQLTMQYNVGGYLPGGLQALAEPVDQVLGIQVRRLKSFAETGKPVP
jgi:uncharacterized protein YndB with AHSA1/START domain